MVGGMKAWVRISCNNLNVVFLCIELLDACLHGVIDFHPDLFLGLLDFAPTYAPQRAHSVYCTRRYLSYLMISPLFESHYAWIMLHLCFVHEET